MDSVSRPCPLQKSELIGRLWDQEHNVWRVPPHATGSGPIDRPKPYAGVNMVAVRLLIVLCS